MKLSRKPYFAFSRYCAANRAVNAKANHDTGEHGHSGNDVELHAVEHLVDVYLRERANRPADESYRPKTGEPASQLPRIDQNCAKESIAISCKERA